MPVVCPLSCEDWEDRHSVDVAGKDWVLRRGAFSDFICPHHARAG